MIQISETVLLEAQVKKELGNKLFQEKKFDEAIQAYSDAIGINPNEGVFYSNRAACYLALKQYKNAHSDCDSALRIDPTNFKTLRRKALSQQNLGLFEESINSFKAALALAPQDANLSQECSQSQQINSNYQEALKQNANAECEKALYYIQQVNNAVPNVMPVQVLMIECLAKVGETDRASKWLMQLNNEHGSTPDVYFLKGLIELYNGNSEKAKKVLLDGMKIDPDNTKCREVLKKARQCENLKDKGNQLLSESKLKEAVECYDEALQVDPYNKKMNAIIYSNRGLVKKRIGTIKEAIEDFTKASELNPQYYKAFLRRAECYDSLGQFDDAELDYNKIIQIEPTLEQQYTAKVREMQKKSKLAKKKDYYKILEVERTATESEVKKAYRKMALIWHPDKQMEANEEQKKIADQKFRDIAEAYSVLSDRKKKELFDSGVDPFDQSGGYEGGADPSQVFQMFFGGGGGFSQFSQGGGMILLNNKTYSKASQVHSTRHRSILPTKLLQSHRESYSPNKIPKVVQSFDSYISRDQRNASKERKFIIPEVGKYNPKYDYTYRNNQSTRIRTEVSQSPKQSNRVQEGNQTSFQDVIRGYVEFSKQTTRKSTQIASLNEKRFTMFEHLKLQSKIHGAITMDKHSSRKPLFNAISDRQYSPNIVQNKALNILKFSKQQPRKFEFMNLKDLQYDLPVSKSQGRVSIDKYMPRSRVNSQMPCFMSASISSRLQLRTLNEKMLNMNSFSQN